ncbi:unnamed protein product [Polarella glacialis]|uniref:Non-specific serine/threonine protein kinase n=1 Tax=Polarella glacialis TaxID=89957 RepID=A0A813HDF6_POLGL|nr:unnamed protein product [Polarella glacialis]
MDSVKFAVKSFSLRGIDEAAKIQLAGELEVFLSMDHPHVARLHGVYEAEEKISLAMECMTGGELFDRVVQKEVFTEKDAALSTWHMLQSVSYIHREGVVHRDLKLENFLYDAPGSEFLKLIDFGFSKFYKGLKMNEALGTLHYAAPEVLRKDYRSGSCDMWSLGVIVFILLSGCMPFARETDAETMRAIVKGSYTMKPGRWGHISKQGIDFVRRLLVVNPKERLTAKGALVHPWIRQRRGGSGDFVGGTELSIAQGFISFAKATRFRRACLQLMAWSLTLDERRQLRQAFIELSDSHGGVVKKKDLDELLKGRICDVEGKPCPTLIEAVAMLDFGPNDEIRYSDFLAAMMACTDFDAREGAMRATFRRLDANGGGYISEKDLQEVLGEGADVRGIILEIADEARYNGEVPAHHKVSVEEFMAYLKGGDQQLESHGIPEKWQYSALAMRPAAAVKEKGMHGRLKARLRALIGRNGEFGGA